MTLISAAKIYRLVRPYKMNIFNNFYAINSERFLGKHGCILGKTGMGKSVTCARIAEEMDKAGFTVLMIDQDGDYTDLPNWNPNSWTMFGRSKKPIPSPFTEARAEAVVDRLVDEQKSTVLYVGQYRHLEALEAIYKVLSALWDRVCYLRSLTPQQARDRDIEHQINSICVFADEAHKLVPQFNIEHKELSQLLYDFSKQGRKRGLTLTVASQRPSAVSKDILTQVDWGVYHRVTYPNDLDTYSEILNFQRGDSKSNRAYTERVIMGLAPGQGYYNYDAVAEGQIGDNGLRRVDILMRQSNHTSKTPGRESLRA